ncbi:MAG: DUF4082 domain-containing protein [Bacteroidota bacterium]
MNNPFFILLLSLLLPLGLVAQVSLNDTGNIPDSSAMLDVQSTEKGFLTPRMSSAQRAAISKPAQGLLVYDTNTKSFWYFDGTAWQDLSSTQSSYLSDTDNDTKIKVEEIADEDVIRMSVKGSDRVWIDSTDFTANTNFYVSHGDAITSTLTTAHETGNTTSIVHIRGRDSWQSFKATENGRLDSIQLYFETNENRNLTISLYEGGGTNGPLLARIRPWRSSGSRWKTIPFTDPIFLEKDQKYTIRFNNQNGIRYSNSPNEYPDGQSYLGSFIDYWFRVYQSEEVRVLSVEDTVVRINGDVTARSFEGDGSGLTNVPGDNLGDHIATQNLQLDSNWLSHDGGNEGIFITPDGDVGIGTDTPQSKLEVNGTAAVDQLTFADGSSMTSAPASTGILTLGVGDFQAQSNGDVRNVVSGTSAGLGGTYVTGSTTSLIAPINLPHGAVIKKITVYGYDLHSTNIRTRIVYSGFHASNYTTIARLTSNTSAGAYTLNANVNTTVNNSQHFYYALVELVGGSWHSAGQLAINAIKIEYNMP